MILGIVGKTNSGKDGVAKYIKEKYDVPMVVSYTTRPKRDYETNGKEHWFVDKDKMAELKNRDDVIAYTINEKTGIEYCAIAGALDSENMTYIINPEGIKWFYNNCKDNSLRMYSIYVDSKEEDIIHRGINRGDDVETLKLRLDSEREEFNEFRDGYLYDYLVDNDKTLDSLYHKIDRIMYGLGFRIKVLR
jgi:guanylate kinase